MSLERTSWKHRANTLMDVLTHHDFCSTFNCGNDDFPLVILHMIFCFPEKIALNASLCFHTWKTLNGNYFIPRLWNAFNPISAGYFHTWNTVFQFDENKHSIVRSFWTLTIIPVISRRLYATWEQKCLFCSFPHSSVSFRSSAAQFYLWPIWPFGAF